MSEHTPNPRDERLQRIAGALRDGLVLVDADGAVVWIDRTARRRVNGELQNLVLPLAKSETDSVDCFISPVELTVNGERLSLGVIQETEAHRYGADLIAAIEGVFADSTSWFARTVIDRLRSINPDKPCQEKANVSGRLEMLSDRERDVLGLICEGRDGAEMAKTLGLSENTVRNHTASLYRKIGVNRRTAAVIWARERGISCRDDVLLGRHKRSVDPRSNGSSNGKGGISTY